MKDTVTFLNEEFENDKRGEKVQGVAIIIDVKLKEVLDIIKQKNDVYSNFTDIIRDAVFEGFIVLLKKKLILIIEILTEAILPASKGITLFHL